MVNPSIHPAARLGPLAAGQAAAALDAFEASDWGREVQRVTICGHPHAKNARFRTFHCRDFGFTAQEDVDAAPIHRPARRLRTRL
jgi:hypothetical protein